MKVQAKIKIDEYFEIDITLNRVDPVEFDLENFMDTLKESVLLNWNKNENNEPN